MYRLKHVDFEGKVTYSPVRTGKILRKNNIGIYPDPTTGIVHIIRLTGDENTIIYDIMGAVRQTMKPDHASISIHLGNLVDGLYYIRMINPNRNVTSQKIAKRNSSF